jgi:N-acetyl-gamma-glutamyl-phosphate reductase
MSYKIFIDGEAGTTGLQVRERLLSHPDAELIQLADADRKDASHRRDAMAAADAVILCLPDESAMEAVDMASGMDCRIIDASTAHRTADGWVYGFPELTTGQRDRIAASRHIANVGCYASAMIAMIRPLTEHQLLSPDAGLSISAVSGYSGGGKALISYMDTHPDDAATPHHFAYGLNLNHKHLPEVMMHGGLNKPPVFTPMVGDFYAGMMVMLPLHLDQMRKQVSIADIHTALGQHYRDEPFVTVHAPNEQTVMNDRGFLGMQDLVGSNRMDIHLFYPEQRPDTAGLIVARLDNLGKGASGAAVQNMNIALGLDETAGLI